MKAKHEPIPGDFPVRPLKPGQKAKDRATCGHCGLSWDDGKVTSMTPAPGGRCPFEAFHIEEDKPLTLTITIELGNAAFVDDGADEVARILADLAERLPEPLKDTNGDYSLRDINGNWCGKARIE